MNDRTTTTSKLTTWHAVACFMAVTSATAVTLSIAAGVGPTDWPGVIQAGAALTLVNTLGFCLAALRLPEGASVNGQAYLAVSSLAALACLLAVAVVGPTVQQWTGSTPAVSVAATWVAAAVAVSVFRFATNLGWLAGAPEHVTG